MGDALGFLDAELAALGESGLLRDPTSSTCSNDLLNLCSNDYLGYGREPWPAAAVSSGATASRLVFGSHPAHDAAEVALANWVGTEAALLFSSAYAANLGTLGALAGPGDLIVSDALNHASIVDGCRLSRAEIAVVPHLDIAATDAALTRGRSARRRFVVTESYFGMDGDLADLPALRGLCDKHAAVLVVDEAHALGVLGAHGAGQASASGVCADVLVGGCGKALGLQGAFVAGSATLRSWLWNRARSFVFSTGISPTLAEAIRLRVVRAQADDAGRARIAHAASWLRSELAGLGIATSGSGAVIPWVLGTPEAALSIARRLRDQGVMVQAIRPPTVPNGTSRLRVTVSARHTDNDLNRAATAFAAVAR